MQVNTRAIVLSAIKYAEADLIVSCYTEDHGLKSYLLRGVRKSRKGKLRSSYFQPLTLLEITAVHRDKGSLERISEVRLSETYHTIHTDLKKSSIAMFLSEVLKDAIKEEEANPAKFQFLIKSLLWLDNHDRVANFHILFMLRLSGYLGFFPDTDGPGDWFNLEEGYFSQSPSGFHCENNRATGLLKLFCGIDFDKLSTIKINQKERFDLLQLLINYYRVHIHGFKEPRSLLVLNQLFL